MAYLGGKSKGSEHILQVLNHEMFDNYDFIEPMVGYAHILRRVINKKSYTASDVNPLLITLLKAIQSNTPLPTITRERYNHLRNQTDITLERAVAAFQYSFNGKEWGGWVGGKNDTPTYARPNGRIDNMAAAAAAAAVYQIPNTEHMAYSAMSALEAFTGLVGLRCPKVQGSFASLLGDEHDLALVSGWVLIL